jgi:2-oxoglutarate ferredoxin oxidoreductase subunit alpha
MMHQGSHGDTRHIVLIPHDNSSAFDMAWQAFDVADRFQTPVFVMMDLDLGMNMSLSAPFKMPDRPIDRGKLLSEADIKAQGDKFSRYLDVDGDGIPQRTIPGNQHPAAAYFARGSGHDERANYSEDHVVYRKLLERLRRKYETAREFMPKPIVYNGASSGVGLMSFGSSYEPTREARDILEARGKATDHLLLRALPVNGDVRDFLAAHQETFLIEQNRDGQMTQILRDEFPEYAARIKSVCLFDGMPLAAGDIVEKIMGGHR